MDPVQMIRDDHEQVRGLFRAFDTAPDNRTRERLAKHLILTLEVLATIEEEFLYAQVRTLDGTQDVIAAAEAEHHDADAVMLSLSELPRGDKNYDARFDTLRRIMEHHMSVEEGEILPRAYLLDPGVSRQMTERMEKRRRELLAKTPFPIAGRRPRRTARSVVRRGQEARQAQAG